MSNKNNSNDNFFENLKTIGFLLTSIMQHYDLFIKNSMPKLVIMLNIDQLHHKLLDAGLIPYEDFPWGGYEGT